MCQCNKCFNSGIIVDYCNNGIKFGSGPINSNLVVDVQHNATKKIQTFDVVSDEFGMVEITNVKLDSLQGYTITFRNCNKFNICEVEYDCITFKVSNTSNYILENPINLIECSCEELNP
jgi:hypothetical protein